MNYVPKHYRYPKHSTIRNTDKSYYNCGGYALSTYRWYLPAPDHASWAELEATREDGAYDLVWELSVANIMSEFPELRLLDSFDVEARHIDYKKYEIIAFRWEEDEYGDFHFMKLGRDGCWYDKRGSARRINKHGYMDIFDIWYGRYDGMIAFFSRPR